MSHPDTKFSQEIPRARDLTRRVRPSGRVGLTRATMTREPDLPLETDHENEMLRLYSRLRELDEMDEMDGSELCKAIDYSLKIFGLMSAAPATSARSLLARLAKSNETDRQ